MQDDSPPELYIASSLDTRELDRALHISLLGTEKIEQPATFLTSSESTVEIDWERWIEGPFQTVIAPAFVAIFEATHATHHADIVRHDSRLNKALDPELQARSLAAARIFLERKSDVRHMSQWVRFEEKLVSGEASGHLSSLFAIQAALFSVPLFSSLISYARLEWKAALPDRDPIADSVFEHVTPVVRACVSPTATGEDTEFLRVV
ncbi:MAG: hypothetical protein HKN23_16215 [Verrucomicrobiales bacterium]|nr:hypothetical protein [Verrucomicrobiales bacterium]